jgi:hypothetical protein
MINTDRIVPVTVTDLLTLYGNIMKLNGTSVAAVEAVSPGVFELTSGSGNLLANEPVKSLDFGEGVTSATVYFIPTYDYVGFTVEGATATLDDSSVEVNADGRTLYTATLADGEVTIAQVGF